MGGWLVAAIGLALVWWGVSRWGRRRRPHESDDHVSTEWRDAQIRERRQHEE